MASHAGHDHPQTKAGRAACRAGKATKIDVGEQPKVVQLPVTVVSRREFQVNGKMPDICANQGCGKEISKDPLMGYETWIHIDGSPCPKTYTKMGTNQPCTYDQQIKPMQRCPHCGAPGWTKTPHAHSDEFNCGTCGHSKIVKLK